MGELYLEAQPDFAQIDELEENQGITARPVTDEDRQRITERAGADAARIDWVVAEAELVKRAACRSRSRRRSSRATARDACRRRTPRPPRRARTRHEPRRGRDLLIPSCWVRAGPFTVFP